MGIAVWVAGMHFDAFWCNQLLAAANFDATYSWLQLILNPLHLHLHLHDHPFSLMRLSAILDHDRALSRAPPIETNRGSSVPNSDELQPIERNGFSATFGRWDIARRCVLCIAIPGKISGFDELFKGCIELISTKLCPSHFWWERRYEFLCQTNSNQSSCAFLTFSILSCIAIALCDSSQWDFLCYGEFAACLSFYITNHLPRGALILWQ